MSYTINVKTDFGASGNGSDDDRLAIQNAIDHAETVDRDERQGVTLFFPKGIYLIKDCPLQLPRLSFEGTILFKGEGWKVSYITNGGTGSDPLFITDPDLTNPNESVGYVFEDLQLGVGVNQEVLKWDLRVPAAGDDLSNPRDPGRRFSAFFHRVLFRSKHSTKPLVFIRGGFRVRFDDCMFYGANETNGVALKFLNTGGITVSDSHVIGLPGALIDAEYCGEIVMSNCRSEGGKGRPAWKFTDSIQITLINPNNEGTDENPSVFYFEGCSDVRIINPQFAAANRPYTVDTYADGIQFINCENCHIEGATTGQRVKANYSIPPFHSLGDGTARLIRVDSRSNYITGSGLSTSSETPLQELAINGKFCRFEIMGVKPDTASGADARTMSRIVKRFDNFPRSVIGQIIWNYLYG